MPHKPANHSQTSSRANRQGRAQLAFVLFALTFAQADSRGRALSRPLTERAAEIVKLSGEAGQQRVRRALAELPDQYPVTLERGKSQILAVNLVRRPLPAFQAARDRELLAAYRVGKPGAPSLAELARVTGAKPWTVRRWVKGTHPIRAEFRLKLLAYLLSLPVQPPGEVFGAVKALQSVRGAHPAVVVAAFEDMFPLTFAAVMLMYGLSEAEIAAATFRLFRPRVRNRRTATELAAWTSRAASSERMQGALDFAHSVARGRGAGKPVEVLRIKAGLDRLGRSLVPVPSFVKGVQKRLALFAREIEELQK